MMVETCVWLWPIGDPEESRGRGLVQRRPVHRAAVAPAVQRVVRHVSVEAEVVAVQHGVQRQLGWVLGLRLPQLLAPAA